MNSISCNICFKVYNDDLNCPLFLVCCGQSICRECSQLASHDKKSLKCPFCNQFILLSRLLKNIAITSSTENSCSFSCESHKKILVIYCKNCEKELCPVCIEDHAQGHVLRDLSNYTTECLLEIGSCSSILEKSEEKIQIMNSIINFRKKNLEKYISESIKSCELDDKQDELIQNYLKEVEKNFQGLNISKFFEIEEGKDIVSILKLWKELEESHKDKNKIKYHKAIQNTFTKSLKDSILSWALKDMNEKLVHILNNIQVQIDQENRSSIKISMKEREYPFELDDKELKDKLISLMKNEEDYYYNYEFKEEKLLEIRDYMTNIYGDDSQNYSLVWVMKYLKAHHDSTIKIGSTFYSLLYPACHNLRKIYLELNEPISPENQINIANTFKIMPELFTVYVIVDYHHLSVFLQKFIENIMYLQNMVEFGLYDRIGHLSAQNWVGAVNSIEKYCKKVECLDIEGNTNHKDIFKAITQFLRNRDSVYGYYNTSSVLVEPYQEALLNIQSLLKFQNLNMLKLNWNIMIDQKFLDTISEVIEKSFYLVEISVLTTPTFESNEIVNYDSFWRAASQKKYLKRFTFKSGMYYIFESLENPIFYGAEKVLKEFSTLPLVEFIFELNHQGENEAFIPVDDLKAFENCDTISLSCDLNSFKTWGFANLLEFLSNRPKLKILIICLLMKKEDIPDVSSNIAIFLAKETCDCRFTLKLPEDMEENDMEELRSVIKTKNTILKNTGKRVEIIRRLKV